MDHTKLILNDNWLSMNILFANINHITPTFAVKLNGQ